LVDINDDVSVVVLDFFKRHAADDSVTQRLDDFAGFDDALHVDAVYRAAVVFADDDVLRHINQTTGQIAGIGGLQSSVSQTLTRAVGRAEVLQHGPPFADVRPDGR